MHKLLIKLFIKNSEDINDVNVRARYGSFAGGMGIVSNLFLAFIKIMLGILCGSYAILSDGINNLTDGASSLITLVGFHMSKKEADMDHPYGHQRLEYVTGLIVAFIIMIIGFTLVKDSIMGIVLLINGTPKELNVNRPVIVVGLIVFSIFVKLWQVSFYKYVGKKIDSTSIKATAQDSLNDSLTSFAILISTLIYIISKGKINIDSLASLMVAVFIIYTSVGLIRETIDPLLGITPSEKTIKEIENKIKSYEGVLGIHDLVYHSYGANMNFCTVHVEVSREVDVMESHDLIDNIEMDIKKEMNINLTIHMDPVEVNDQYTLKAKGIITEVLNKIDKDLKFHDFRIVRGITHTNVLFDIVVPFNYRLSEEELKSLVSELTKEVEPTYNTLISIDKMYTHNIY